MSTIIRVVLDEPVVRPGQPVSFVVLLDPQDERVRLAQKLTVSLQWRAMKKYLGNFNRPQIGEAQRKAEATWSPELPLRMEYNVTLTLPERAPLTYDGKVIAIEWYLVALLDVPRKQNGYLELPVRAVPRGSA